MKNPIIVITGPTASGKTALSLSLAKKFKGEIICADSMTVYKEMDIGTDKVTKNSKFKIQNSKNGVSIINGITHHLLDLVSPNEEFNVATFVDLAKKEIDEIHKRGNTAFIVGGSTLYIDALIYEYEMPRVEPDESLRKKLEREKTEDLFRKLVRLDPDAEWTIDRKNKRRLIRALEVCIKTKKPFTAQKQKNILPKNVLYLALDGNRDELYKKINQRVEEMMENGFLEETKKLFEKYDHDTALQAAGYKQLIEYIEGKLDLESAIEKTKQVHRNFAKRQLTWLRKNPDVIWIKDQNDAEIKIKNFLK